jgi:hypothetical protein
VVNTTAVLRLAQAGLELGHRGVQGGVAVLRGGLRAHDRAAGQDGELDPLALVSEAWVAFLGALDVDADHLRVELFQLGQLLRDVRAKRSVTSV